MIAGLSFGAFLILLLVVLSWLLYPKPLSFSGKHVLVTGGSKGKRHSILWSPRFVHPSFDNPFSRT